ncbi:hypothetical protein F4815DRAFT_457463 [Daldinia loculata]|nr:hypothetical protein F4815DRAFT_457463 [Daldinia loculata]
MLKDGSLTSHSPGFLMCNWHALASGGLYIQMGLFYYLFVVMGSFISLGAMISSVKLDDALSCWWWFQCGFRVTGGFTCLSHILEYAFAG